MAMPSTDTDELAKFGYKQELDRSLGLFSSFAAGFSYISIMTGVFELFFFGFGSGGPAFIWTWPAVFIGQMLVALCFAELAGQYPLAGSVYQWSKQIARPFTSFFGGWILTVGSIVTLAAVAVAYQVVLPQISAFFEFIGGPADIGLVSTPAGAKNALLLAAGLVVFTTIINMIGVKLMARINNFGVIAELIGVTLLIILLAAHIRRSPAVVFDTFGTGAGYPWGYFGAFLVAGLMSAYVMYGFDTAGSLAEETHDPRKHAPPAIIRALTAAGIAGFLVILFGEMAVPNIHAKELGTSGLPYLVKATLGGPIGNVFLIDSVIAITVCALAVHTGGIRMIFTMGRDGRLPFASAVAKVHGRSKTPLVPSHHHRRADHRAAAAERGQPAGVLRAHLGRDHHVLPRLPVRHRAAAGRAAPRQMAVARSRSLLLAGPLGTAGEPDGRGLPDHRPGQPGLAAPGGLRRRQVVLPVGGLHLHRRARRRGRHLLPGQAARPADDGAGRAPGH